VHLLTLLTPVHSLNLLSAMLPEQRAWRDFARLRQRHRVPDVRILNAFRLHVGVMGLRQINETILQPLIQTAALWENATALIDATDLPAACSGFKKNTGTYTAQHAALGARTRKTGQSRWFGGYKKHSFRLWWRAYSPAVLLVPLVSWVAPAKVSEGGLLVPSLQYCDQRWSWWPRQVVADRGYLAAESKRRGRERWRVAIVTHLRSDMKLVAPFVSEREAACEQGQPLAWLGYDVRDDLHWFGPLPPAELCLRCWQASRCPRQFAYAPAAHETLLGLLPLNTPAARRLLQQVRPWIEPAQAYEKNQLGLSALFFNSLRLTWCMALLAEAAVLWRAHALLHAPPSERALLCELALRQGELNFET